MKLVYKVGPLPLINKWGANNLTPISRVKQPQVKPIHFRPFIGVASYNDPSLGSKRPPCDNSPRLKTFKWNDVLPRANSRKPELGRTMIFLSENFTLWQVPDLGFLAGGNVFQVISNQLQKIQQKHDCIHSLIANQGKHLKTG